MHNSKCIVSLYQQKQTTMTILEKIETLKAKLSTVRSNSEYNKTEKQILKLAKKYNEQNHYQRFFIYDNNVYGLEKNPNYLNN